jgi:anthranilate phosphoribosyltransferase
VSSLCGSADVLEALGVAVELDPAGVTSCLEQAGVAFMYAPAYHPAMKARVGGCLFAMQLGSGCTGLQASVVL